MKILLVAQEQSKYITSRVISEAEGRGHKIQLCKFTDISFDIGKQTAISIKGHRMGEFDAVVLRMAGPGKIMVFYKELIVRQMAGRCYVLNGDSFVKWPMLNKIVQNYMFSKYKLPIVDTVVYGSKNLVIPEKLVFPLIIKKSFGRLGKGIYKVENLSEFGKIVDQGINDLMIQEFITTGEDYRVMVIGGKAIGKVMKKKAPKNGFITNVAQGGITESIKINRQLKAISEKAVSVFDAEYCGVDIVFDKDNNPHIYEINRSAAFAGFEKTTKINIAGKIIEYIENKANMFKRK